MKYKVTEDFESLHLIGGEEFACVHVGKEYDDYINEAFIQDDGWLKVKYSVIDDRFIGGYTTKYAQFPPQFFQAID